MELLTQAAIFALCLAAAWGLWQLGRTKPMFQVRISDGRARRVSGTVTNAFLNELSSVAEQNEIARGWVSGIPSGTLVRLRFSNSFPPGARQQVLNWWVISGWGTGRKMNRACRTG